MPFLRGLGEGPFQSSGAEDSLRKKFVTSRKFVTKSQDSWVLEQMPLLAHGGPQPSSFPS